MESKASCDQLASNFESSYNSYDKVMKLKSATWEDYLNIMWLIFIASDWVKMPIIIFLIIIFQKIKNGKFVYDKNDSMTTSCLSQLSLLSLLKQAFYTLTVTIWPWIFITNVFLII